MVNGPLYVGTAGWGIAARYIEALPLGGTHLERYGRRLNAVEINSSFYRQHQTKTYARWAASTPPGFRFAVKIPRSITHERRLVGCEPLLAVFAAQVAGLGDKLGVLLLQLPPSLPFEAGIADRFLVALRRHLPAAVACEPRHRSWFAPEVERFLEEGGVARVAADPAPAPGAGEAGGWRGLAYYRWHGAPQIYVCDYDAAALAALRRRLRAERARDIAVWCIFDNTAAGAALGNALSLTK